MMNVQRILFALHKWATIQKVGNLNHGKSLSCNKSSILHVFNRNFFDVTFCQHGTGAYFFNATVLRWNISSMQHFVNTVPISSMQQFFYETFRQHGTLYLFLQCNSSSMKHLFNATFRQHGTYFFNATVLLWNIYSIRISEPGYLAGAGAITLARLHLEYLFNNSRKKHGT